MKEISELNLIGIGRITKTYGYKGSLVIHLNINFENIYETEHVFVDIDGIYVPFFISDNNFKSYKKNLSIIKLLDIDTEDEAKKLIGKNVLLPENDIFKETKSLLGDIINYKVYNVSKYIGIVESYLEIPSNPILNIIPENKKEILIPFNDNFIKSIDKQKKELILDIPEGLLELN